MTEPLSDSYQFRMRANMLEETPFDTAGEGIEISLPGDTIRLRHIATRASNRRQIVVAAMSDFEVAGYSIGLDDHSLQILELDTGEVTSIALEHIVAISDGTPFDKLTPDQKDVVDRRTASFRKTSQAWLVKNWPGVYDRSDDEGFRQPRPRRLPPSGRYGDRSRLEPGRIDSVD